MFEYYYTKPFKFRFSMYIQIGYRVMKIKCFSRYLELQKSVTKNLQGKAVICHINYWDQVNSWKKVWKFRNDPLCRNKSGPFPYSMLQYIGRVAAPKLVPRTCLRYLQTTLIIGRGALVSELMWGIIGFLLLHCK